MSTVDKNNRQRNKSETPIQSLLSSAFHTRCRQPEASVLSPRNKRCVDSSTAPPGGLEDWTGNETCYLQRQEQSYKPKRE